MDFDKCPLTKSEFKELYITRNSQKFDGGYMLQCVYELNKYIQWLIYLISESEFDGLEDDEDED